MLLMIFLAVIAFVASLLVILAVYIKRRPWLPKKMKLVYSAYAAFIFFPVLAPAATIVAIPMPNIVFLIGSLLSSPITTIMAWYLKTAVFNAVSYAVSFGLFALLSQVIFFEKPKTVSATPDNAPQ